MSFNNGLNDATAAARLPWMVKYGPISPKDRYMVDDSKPNNWFEFEDNAAGTAKIHWLTAVNTANQTDLHNPNGVVSFGLQIVQMTTPAAPTITTSGTAGAATWTYVIVARNGVGATLGTTPASASGSTTTGNATLTTSNYNVISFASVPGAAFYDVYRTVSGGTPSTTGLIGSVAAFEILGTGTQNTPYLFNDTGQAGDGTTAPTVNTSGFLASGNTSTALLTPANVVATPQGTAGSTTITYKIVAVNEAGAVTAASSAATTTTANATLTSANNVLVTWNSVLGASNYKIYRTAAGGTPSTTGLIGTITATSGTQSFTDTGQYDWRSHHHRCHRAVCRTKLHRVRDGGQQRAGGGPERHQRQCCSSRGGLANHHQTGTHAPSWSEHNLVQLHREEPQVAFQRGQ